SIGDCKFCYMSTQKKLIKDPKKARRSKESILAEAIISKKLGWKLEFISGGYESYTKKELLFLIKNISEIFKEKIWLNIGVLNEKELKLFEPYIIGICGTVECINPKLHDNVCPSKPLKKIIGMFELCDRLKLKKAITIILGLGETRKDFERLKQFIEKYKINKITFYRLKHHKGTVFEGKKELKTEDYVYWVKKTRQAFPKIKIITGSWLNHLDEINLLLKAGANAITKFPVIRRFNSEDTKLIEKQVEEAGRSFESYLNKIPSNVDWDKEVERLSIDEDLKKQVKIKLKDYLDNMKKKK
ncbi:MAG: radical SAM protein, partial [Nanoarchaeota archaeon]|nr:radical SAM protein [Nanoarchaeota archaeon]